MAKVLDPGGSVGRGTGEGGSWTPSTLQAERDAFRRARTRRSTSVAAVSTVVLLTVLVVSIVGSPGWPRVQQTFFSPAKAVDAFPAVLTGLWLNVRLVIVCALLITLLSVLLAVMRTLRGPVAFPLRLISAVYTDVFRGLPLLLVIFLLGFGVPALRLQGLPSNGLFWGGAALVLTYSAYVSEVLRAGIESVHPSQRAAARSLGLSYAQTLRFVVLPQGVRQVTPALMNDLVSLIKDSGLIAILGVAIDAIRAAQIETAADFNYTPYVVAGVLFVCLTVPLVRFTDWLARRKGLHAVGGIV